MVLLAGFFVEPLPKFVAEAAIIGEQRARMCSLSAFETSSARRGRRWSSARGMPVFAGATAIYSLGPLIHYPSIL
jgi:hypothetical protein